MSIIFLNFSAINQNVVNLIFIQKNIKNIGKKKQTITKQYSQLSSMSIFRLCC